jgi:2-polyprenyl-3-methyl-5-hydroxy-6-metoxy-1,4-benzoquinol methylase
MSPNISHPPIVANRFMALNTGHFRFGENWRSFSTLIDEPRIAEAVRGLQKLISAEDLEGKRFLDIGCGSGLSMVAALRLGATEVVGTDIDPDSILAARDVLSRFAATKAWHLRRCNVFDMESNAFGIFDVVYGWGVLHHTGDMWSALIKTGTLVKQNGLLVLALYHKTPMCRFWRIEKRFYANAPAWQQRVVRSLYKGTLALRLIMSGQHSNKYSRGMDRHHDVHDWLGGYPYESTLPQQVVQRLENNGFAIEKVLENCAGSVGLLGTGCDEYVARRNQRIGSK